MSYLTLRADITLDVGPTSTLVFDRLEARIRPTLLHVEAALNRHFCAMRIQEISQDGDATIVPPFRLRSLPLDDGSTAGQKECEPVLILSRDCTVRHAMRDGGFCYACCAFSLRPA